MRKILTIGPDYRTLKGGVASVLEVYSKYDKKFTFLPTYSSENNIINVLKFPINYFKIFFFLLLNPSYKIVHIHGASRISFYRKYFLFLHIKYILGRKVIYHIHGGEYHLFIKESNKLVYKCIKHMLEKSDAIICLSKQWEDFFVKEVNPKAIYILNNTIEMPKLKKIKKSDKLTFLFLGRIGERKGVFDLLSVVTENKAIFQEKISLVIGGDGDIERLQKDIEKYDLQSIVKYVGWISGEDKYKLLQSSDVYILPSYNEGLPISILEAMSYKMPIISTDVGGISTIVKNNQNGFLITPGNNTDIFNAMQYFLDNPSKITEYGEKSYKLVQDFLPEKVLKDLYNIYNEICK